MRLAWRITRVERDDRLRRPGRRGRPGRALGRAERARGRRPARGPRPRRTSATTRGRPDDRATLRRAAPRARAPPVRARAARCPRSRVEAGRSLPRLGAARRLRRGRARAAPHRRARTPDLADPRRGRSSLAGAPVSVGRTARPAPAHGARRRRCRLLLLGSTAAPFDPAVAVARAPRLRRDPARLVGEPHRATDAAWSSPPCAHGGVRDGVVVVGPAPARRLAVGVRRSAGHRRSSPSRLAALARARVDGRAARRWRWRADARP